MAKVRICKLNCSKISNNKFDPLRFDIFHSNKIQYHVTPLAQLAIVIVLKSHSMFNYWQSFAIAKRSIIWFDVSKHRSAEHKLLIFIEDVDNYIYNDKTLNLEI